MSDERRRELETQLSAYLDGELGLAQRREVEARLAVDEAARTLLKQLQATAEAVRSLPRARASERLIESLRARMERQSLLEGRPAPARAAGSARSYFRWAAAAAVIALAVGSGYLIWPLARDQISRSGQQYAMRGNENEQARRTEPGFSAGAPVADRADRAVGEPAPPALVAEPAARDPASGLTEGEGTAAKKDLLGDKMASTSERSGDYLAARGRLEADSTHERFGEKEKASSKKAVVEISAAPSAPPVLSDVVAGGQARIEAIQAAPAEDLPAHTTVLEATFADAASQRDAVERLRDDYAFRPVAPSAQPQGGATALEVRVSDDETARRVVSSLEESSFTGGSLRIVSRGVSFGREMRMQDQDADVRDARRRGALHAGVTRSGESFDQAVSEPGQKPPVAAMERLRPNGPSESPRSFDTVNSLRTAEQGATRPIDQDTVDRGGLAPAKRRSAGYGAFGDNSEGLSPPASSAPAAAAARPARPNQPTRELTPSAAIVGGATRPAEPPMAGVAGHWHRGFDAEGRQAPSPNVVRLYVHIEPPATGPADTRPASDQ